MNRPLSTRALQSLADADILSSITPELEAVAAQFSVAITDDMLALINPAASNDPISAQFVPSAAELHIAPNELADPISDDPFSPTEGITHRHADRVLLKLTHTCAVYCRFCFRREKVGKETSLSSAELENAFRYIEQHPEIWEVILTGGDPLILSDRRIKETIQRLNAIEHVKVIRIHTRIPVVDPERITPELIASLKGQAPVYILIHCNHPRELTEAARAACARLVDAGIPLLSQSVLLREINDHPDTLAALMRAFVENRIKPHYLHHMDLARGTSHFRVPLKEGQELLKQLRGQSGLCQPAYILDLPGGHGKVPVGPVFIEQKASEWIVEDSKGCLHSYADSPPECGS